MLDAQLAWRRADGIRERGVTVLVGNIQSSKACGLMVTLVGQLTDLGILTT